MSLQIMNKVENFQKHFNIVTFKRGPQKSLTDLTKGAASSEPPGQHPLI